MDKLQAFDPLKSPSNISPLHQEILKPEDGEGSKCHSFGKIYQI